MDQLSEAALAELIAICPGGVARDVDLSAISQWRIGGPADLMVSPSSPAEVSSLMRWFAGRGIRPVVIGLTSNLLFDDAGLRAPCVQIGSRMAGIKIEGQQAMVQAGAWVPGLARKLMQAGLTGAEHICGIPGTIGGLTCMNGGSQRKGISSSIIDVTSIDSFGNQHVRAADKCHFSYRQSIFQTNLEVIVQIQMQFQEAQQPRETRREMLGILAARRKKFPRKQPNCGSVFKSNPALYADLGSPGEVIEKLGFKGRQIGGALVSPVHANFIVNTGGACAMDVLTLIAQINAAACQATGFLMAAEACYVTPAGAIVSADCQTVNYL